MSTTWKENSWNMVPWRRVEKENERQVKERDRKQKKEARISSNRKSKTSAKLSFVRKFFPATKEKPELVVGKKPYMQSKPQTRISEPGIVLSTPKREVATLKPETGSKGKR